MKTAVSFALAGAAAAIWTPKGNHISTTTVAAAAPEILEDISPDLEAKF
jgi:hypothetical protein